MLSKLLFCSNRKKREKINNKQDKSYSSPKAGQAFIISGSIWIIWQSEYHKEVCSNHPSEDSPSDDNDMAFFFYILKTKLDF